MSDELVVAVVAVVAASFYLIGKVVVSGRDVLSPSLAKVMSLADIVNRGAEAAGRDR